MCKATKTSGDALLSLIEEILDFSKIEAGKLELELRPFALATLIEDIVELLGPRAQAKGLEIAADVDERSARARDRRCDAAPPGAAQSRRQRHQVHRDRRRQRRRRGGLRPGDIVFEVRDTGIGIAPEQQARIFHEFEQADGGSARQFGGTGLGLAISRRIVERMGGRIEVESAPGAGSSFRAIVPLPRRRGRRGRARRPISSGLAVLIIAPASVEAALIERRLTRWGASAMHLAPHLAEHVRAAALGCRAGRSSPSAPAKRRGLPRTHRRPAHRADHAGRAAPAAGAEGRRLRRLSGEAGPRSLAQRPACRRAGFESAPQLDAPAATADGRRRRINSLNVLVAEDNEINALLTRSLLTKLGHRAAVAESGALRAGALAGRARRRPAVRPDPDGHAHAGRRRPRSGAPHPRRRGRARSAPRTPIIALTANAFAEDRDACLAAGMDGFLVKPLDRDRLTQALDAVAGKAQLAA